MAKRRQNQSPIGIDVVRWGVTLIFILVAVAIACVALTSFVRHSDLCAVRNIVISANLGEINIPELTKLKGQNIFLVDLEKLEQKIIARYPGIAGLEVLRRFPDEIAVVGTRRTAFVTALMDGHGVALSRDGYVVGPAGKEEGSLVVIKGLQHQRSLPGVKLADLSAPVVLKSIESVAKDPSLAALHLRSLDITDANKATFTFGLAQDPARFDVVIDKDSLEAKIRTLSVMIARTELAVNEVKYIDLRFETPVIGKRKIKK